jgi:hypothetical protein
MWRSIARILLSWGRRTSDEMERRSNTYKPQYQGRWVNKGNKKKYQEEWEWEEKVVYLKNYWVNVFKQGRDSYLILVAQENSEFALEYVQCETPTEVERAIKMYEAYYNNLGKVTVDNSLRSEVETS